MGFFKSLGRAAEMVGSVTADVATLGMSGLSDEGTFTERTARRHRREDQTKQTKELAQAIADIIRAAR